MDSNNMTTDNTIVINYDNISYNISIHNVVVTGSLNQIIPLEKISRECYNFNYDPEIYCGAHLSLKTVSATLYSSGKYIIPGIDSIDKIDEIVNDFFNILSNYLNPTKFEKPEIVNIVATLKLNRKINLDFLCDKLQIEKQNFKLNKLAGILWKTEYGTARIFNSGKVIFLGVKSINQLKELSKYIISTINIYL